MSSLPGVLFKEQGRRAQPSPVHSDVAGFIGRTRRGPLGVATRVEGWRRFVRDFGDLAHDLPLTYALRGYFQNGGEVAYVVRLGGEDRETAEAVWNLSPQMAGPVAPSEYRVRASSPGVWGTEIKVDIKTRQAPTGRPIPMRSASSSSGSNRVTEIDLTVRIKGTAVEYLRKLDPTITDDEESRGLGQTLVSRILAESKYLTLEPLETPLGSTRTTGRDSLVLRLPSGANPTSTQANLAEYLGAVQALGDKPEVAMLVAPALYDELDDEDDRNQVIQALMQQAAELHDRIFLVDAPPKLTDSFELLDYVGKLRGLAKTDSERRSSVLYSPWLVVPDPLGGAETPLRQVAPSGHIAGVISRLDRDRGAHHTPANVPVLEAADLSAFFSIEDAGRLSATGVNLIRCRPGRGLMVWGGRTLDPLPAGRYLAHRRLIHRLVRSIRRVVEPIVFDPNGVPFWLALARAATTVLLEAYRAGALKGDRPDEAFRVHCDENTNPAEQIELGIVICEIQIAPAVPMEFITFRVALSETPQLEVFDL